MTSARDARIAAHWHTLSNEYEPNPECLSAITRETGEWLLIEENTHDSRDYWHTRHDSPEAAAEYHDGQEYGEDWEIVGLWDLNMGTQYEAETRTTFTPVVPEAVHAPR